MSPAPVSEDRVMEAASAITRLPPIDRSVLVVVTLAAKLTAPEVEKPLGAVMFPVEFLVRVPELVTATDPVAVKLLFRAKVVPFRVAELKDTVLENVVAPVAALVWVRLPFNASEPLKESGPELVTVRAVGGVVPPIAPSKVMLPPVPPSMVRVLAPLIVDPDPEKMTLAPAAVPPLFVVSMVVPVA